VKSTVCCSRGGNNLWLMLMVSFVHEAHCDGLYEDVNCLIAIFWKEGFVALQAAINAAIIEVSAKC
jgi:hypothetical protein